MGSKSTSSSDMDRDSGIGFPAYGRRLIPTMIDDIATNTPSRNYASIPIDDADISAGFRNVTYGQLAAAVDFTARWLDEHLGPAVAEDGAPFETLAYYGPRDLRYTTILVAAIKTGRRVLMTSLMGSREATTHLAKTSRCRTFLYARSAAVPATVRAVPEKIEHSRSFEVPEFDDIFVEEDALHVPQRRRYPYAKSWDEAAKDEVAIFHTSGSSGFPKLVTFTHEMLARIDTWNLLPDIDGKPTGRDFFENNRMYCAMPIFHLTGTLTTLPCALFLDTVPVLGPAELPVTPAIFDAVRRHGCIDGVFMPPALLEDIVRNGPAAVRAGLKQIKRLCFGGAPLAKRAGDAVAPHGNLRTIIGSTEGYYWPTVVPDHADWDYLHFHPAMSPTFREHVDGLYELVVKRTRESERFTNWFAAFPEAREFATKDLWSPHPDPKKRAKGLWKYQGRTDDLIVLKGEVKMYAGHLEERLRNHEFVKSALVGGYLRKRPFLLIEVPSEVDVDTKEVLDRVWPLIEAANENVGERGKLMRELALVAAREKPFARLGKGSVDRRGTFKLYEREIDELYGEPVEA